MHQKLEVIIIGYHHVIVSKIVGTIMKFIHLTTFNLHANQYIRTSFTLFFWGGREREREGKKKQRTISGLINLCVYIYIKS